MCTRDSHYPHSFKNFPGLFQPKVKWSKAISVHLFCIVIIKSHILGEELRTSCITLEFEKSFNWTQMDMQLACFLTLYSSHTVWNNTEHSPASAFYKGCFPSPVALAEGSFQSFSLPAVGGPSSSSHLFKPLLRGNQDSDDINKRE